MFSLLFGDNNADKLAAHNAALSDNEDLINALSTLRKTLLRKPVCIYSAIIDAGRVVHYMQRCSVTECNYYGRTYKLCSVYGSLILPKDII